MVDEGFANEHGLQVGSPLSITSMSGKTLDLTVSGIEKSPVLDVLGLGPITISHAAFDGTFEQRRNRLTFADHDAIAGAAAFPNAKAESKADFIDGQTAWIGMILAILWVLLALAVIVSLFGIVNTLVLSTFERMRELGTLRALGFSRRQVRRMVRHESVITALIGASLGIAAGLVLAGGGRPAAGQVRAELRGAGRQPARGGDHRRARGHARGGAARPAGREDRRPEGARLRVRRIAARIATTLRLAVRALAASSVLRTARSSSSPSNGFARNAVTGSSVPASVVSPV